MLSRSSRRESSGNNDLVDSDISIGETGEEEVSWFVPCETGAANWFLLLFVLWINWGGLEVNNEFFAWQVPDLNSGFSTQYEPVFLGSEENAVDGWVDFSLSEVLSFNQVPDDCETVFATRGEIRGLWSHIERVNLGLVSNEGVLKAHGLVIPDLDSLVPRGGDNNWVLGILVELNAWNPVSVSVLLNGELALSNSVPDLQVLVSSTASDLSVIGWEGDSENVSAVTNESSAGNSFLQVPESEGSVPGSAQGISAILRKSDITDEVSVA